MILAHPQSRAPSSPRGGAGPSGVTPGLDPGTDALAENLAVLPSQLASLPAWSPAQRLLAACLIDALAVAAGAAQSGFVRGVAASRAATAEARAWLASDAETPV